MKENYCTQINVTENTRLDLFAPSCFRLRISELDGEKFPAKYEIPFAIGKVTKWDSVSYHEEKQGNTKIIKTKDIIIKLRTADGYKGMGFLVYDSDGKKIFPAEQQKYGMFINKCIVFDSASFFGDYSWCSRYAHAFYDEETGEYSQMLPEDKIMDIFFIYGKTYKQCYELFNTLVGAEPLLPIKAYGGNQTQHLGPEGTQSLLMETARLFREKDIPCDNLILDYEWGDGANNGKEVPWGSRLDWSNEYSQPLPPKQMIEKLQKMHFDVSLMHHSVPDYKDRCDEEWVCAPTNAELWWEKMEALISDGAKGSWQDTRKSDVTDSRVFDGLCKRLGKRPYFVANYDVYGMCSWSAEQVYSPIKQRIGGRRMPYHWTGDMNLDTFEELAFQIKAITNEHGALKGVSYLTNDDMRMGGLKLAVRSEQFLCFNSVMRSHNPKPWETGQSADEFVARIAATGGADATSEIKQSDANLLGLAGADTEQERLIRKFIKLRYRLIPYIYTAARQTFDSGLPITRPLMIEFENDENCNKNQYPREYMFGDKMLVSPVYDDVTKMNVYFPSGCDWIDYFTGEKYSGGSEQMLDVDDLERMPVFVKNGAAITTWEDTNYIVPGQIKTINIEVFGVGNDKIELYEDDGESFEYKNGNYAFTTIYTKATDNRVEIEVLPRQGGYCLPVKQRKFTIVRGKKRVEFEVDTEKHCCFAFDI